MDGGSLGGPGHLTVAGLARPRACRSRINYVPTAGGGESMNLLLSGAATAGIDTVVELKPQIQAGALKVLAVDSDQRVDGVDAPTLKELGLADKAVSTLAGMLAPAGLSADQQKDVVAMVDQMRQSTLLAEGPEAEQLGRGWTPGDAFKTVLTEQRTQITAILNEMGLAK